MLTQCPNCQTIFRVTSEILRVAEGQVRCGRCQTQFDALDRLIDENDDVSDAPRREAYASEQQPSSETIEVEEPQMHEDITLEGRHIEISGTYRVVDRSGNGSSEIHRETTEEWVEMEDVGDESDSELQEPSEEIDLGADLTSDEDADRSASISDENGDVRAQLAESMTGPVRTTGSPRFAQRAAERAQSATDADLFGLSQQRTGDSKMWQFLVVPLLLLLAVQWVHSYRATLARHPTIGEPLMAVYGALGLGLTPNWDLHAYQIRQWGVTSDPTTPGTLRVRASITNLADFAQPYPLLKLVLEDRWGEQVRAREFEPSEYLDPTISPNRLLNPGQHTNATITILDPGPDAEGFRFDACLRGTAGTVCAEEVPRRR